VRRIPRRSFLESCTAASTALGASPFLKGWIPMSKQRHVVVVGAGAFGGWTALHLLRGGARVTLVDAWGPGNSRASSGGETRVIRGTYGPRAIYTRLTARALELWKEHERRWRRKLYHAIGVLWLVESDDAYEKAALPLLRDAGLTVKLNCPLMKANVGQYRQIQALAERLGVLCGFDPMITAKNDGDTSPVQLRITRKDLRQVLEDPALNPHLGKQETCEAPSARGDLDEVPCGASHNACYISAYGDVMPCVAMPIACGNVRDEPFAAIWHRSPEMLRVRSIRIRDLHTCSSCAASQFCTRCPGQALVETGDLYGPSPANCEHALVAAQVAGSAVIPASMLRLSPDR